MQWQCIAPGITARHDQHARQARESSSDDPPPRGRCGAFAKFRKFAEWLVRFGRTLHRRCRQDQRPSQNQPNRLSPSIFRPPFKTLSSKQWDGDGGKPADPQDRLPNLGWQPSGDQSSNQCTDQHYSDRHGDAPQPNRLIKRHGIILPRHHDANLHESGFHGVKRQGDVTGESTCEPSCSTLSAWNELDRIYRFILKRTEILTSLLILPLP